MKTPDRGEIWLVDLGMAAEVRPGLLISVPASETDRARDHRPPHDESTSVSVRAAVSVPFLRTGVFDNTQSLVTIPYAKLVRSLDRLTARLLLSVEAVVRFWLGFDVVSEKR